MPTPRYRGGRPRKHPDGVRTSIHGSGRPPGSARGRPRVEEHGNRTMYTNGCRSAMATSPGLSTGPRVVGYVPTAREASVRV
jgi:hypothetical protein